MKNRCNVWWNYVILYELLKAKLLTYDIILVKEVKTMKKDIHPEYGEAVVKCACGETFVTGSTKKELRVEICSKCHPFFTGKQKLVDTGGRVERFNRRYGLTGNQG